MCSFKQNNNEAIQVIKSSQCFSMFKVKLNLLLDLGS